MASSSARRRGRRRFRGIITSLPVSNAMPITYRIRQDRGRIETVCSGDVTLPDVRAHFDALQRDPERLRNLSVLLDFSGMTSLPGSPQLQAAAERVGQVEEIVFEACAIIADREP